MLAYILALAVGLGSLSLYLSAFLFPEIYRKYDLLWSGLGLFYALVLWICAGRITGSLLLGQMASVALLGWLGWQTLKFRFAETPVEQRIQLQGDSLSDALQNKFVQLQTAFEDGSWRVHTTRVLDQLPGQVADLARIIQGWIEALISTTLKPQEFSMEKTSPPKASDLLKGSYVAEGNPQKSDAQANYVQASYVQASSFKESDRPSPPTSQTHPTHSYASTEFAAEWDELETEVYPELETIDGSGWDFQAPPLLGQETDPQARPKTSEEHSDSH